MFTLFCLGVFAQDINRESSQKKFSVKGYWNVLNRALLEATDGVLDGQRLSET